MQDNEQCCQTCLSVDFCVAHGFLEQKQHGSQAEDIQREVDCVVGVEMSCIAVGLQCGDKQDQRLSDKRHAEHHSHDEQLLCMFCKTKRRSAVNANEQEWG